MKKELKIAPFSFGEKVKSGHRDRPTKATIKTKTAVTWYSSMTYAVEKGQPSSGQKIGKSPIWPRNKMGLCERDFLIN
jgi:hypothetical protein